MMRVTQDSSFDDVEELRRRFEEFRSQHRRRARLPEELWGAAAEIAGRGRKRSAMTPTATFMELLTPATGVAASCIVEVESQRGGKLRLELKGIATSEIAQLIHSFADQ